MIQELLYGIGKDYSGCQPADQSSAHAKGGWHGCYADGIFSYYGYAAAEIILYSVLVINSRARPLPAVLVQHSLSTASAIDTMQ